MVWLAVNTTVKPKKKRTLKEAIQEKEAKKEEERKLKEEMRKMEEVRDFCCISSKSL